MTATDGWARRRAGRPACGIADAPRRREGTLDITQLILDDHHEQRRLFAILEQVSRSDIAALTAIWGRLSAFLEVHAAAEEEVFYPELLQAGQRAGRIGTAEEETLDAIKDHIANSLSIEQDDFEYEPFNQKGGLGKAYQIFGDELTVILQELNERLAA